MFRSIVVYIRQPGTKAKDSLPQDKKAHPNHRPTQSQERKSYVRGLVVICSEGRGHRFNKGVTPMTHLKGLGARYMRLMGKCNNSATRLWTDEDVETGLHTTTTATNHSTIA